MQADIKAIGTGTKAATETVTAQTAIMDADFKGVGVAAVTTAGEEGIGAIAPAVEKAAGVVADQAALMKTALAGVGLGLAAFGMMGMVSDQQTMNQSLIDKIKQERGIKTDTQIATAAAALKQQLQDINQAWADMNALADEFNGKRFLGVLDDPLGGITAADTKIMDLKTHLDDLSNGVLIEVDGVLKNVVIGVDSRQIETADNKVRYLKEHLDDLGGAVSIGTRSVDDAILKVMTLKSQLDDMPTIPVPTTSTPITTPGRPKFASGVTNFSGGLAYVHQGEMLVDMPRGTDVISANNVNAMRSGSGNGPTHLHVYIAGNHVAEVLLPDMANALRSKLGVVGA